MATLLQAESRRLYSWWWDSHISPKNPKWLHENLTDMDAKVKAMIKLIEEDADSFATRAEMYYIKRPELIKLVEEFFRAYRALAERYHHTTWELRQPHWTMAESSPNQIPFSLSDISPSVSSELEHRTPQMPHSIRPLFESEDLQNDTSRVAFPFYPITRNQSYSVDNEIGKAKMGLKQLYEIFAGQTRKVLDFQEEEKNIPGNTLYCLSKLAQRHKGKEKEEKTKCPQEEASKLSSENQNLNSQVLRESEQTGKDETEIHSLCKSLSKLETEKEAILIQYKECLERIYRLEGEMACAKEDTSHLNAEISTGAIKLKEMEIAKRGLEDEIQKMKNDNQILKEQNILLGLLIESLQNDIFYLRAVKWELEEKVWLHLDERSALHQELYRLKEQVKDLDMRHRDVIEQVKFVGLNLWTISSFQKDLQDEKLKLEDCKKIEEKVVLLGKLEFGEKLVEISPLEDSVLDVNVKLDGLREELEKLEESFQPVLGDKSESSISQIENLTQTTENLSNKSTLLKNSFEHVNVELDALQKKLKCLEKTCRSLQDQNSCLLVERCSLISQIEASQTELRDLGKDRLYCLGQKKEVMLHQVHEVQASLNDEGEDHVDFVRSSKTQLANLQNQICLLQEEAILSKREIEQALEEVLTADIVIFVLRSCFLEMKELNSFLSKENQKHIEASKNAENLISELMQESFEQKEKVNLLLDKKDTLNIAICQLLQSLDIKLDNGSQDKIEGQILLQQIFEQIQKMHTSSLDMEEEMRQLTSEKSVNISLIEQLKREASDLESQKNTLEQDLEISTEKLFFLQIEKNELLEVNKQLSEGLKEGHQLQEVLNAGRSILSGKLSALQKAYQMLSSENFKLCEENQSCKEEFYCLKDQKYSLEEEYDVVLKEALVLSYLSLFLENFSIEKTSELKDLQINLDHLHEVNSELEEEVRLMSEKMGRVDKENLDLKESIEKLEKDRNHLIFVEDDLRRVKSINEELDREIRVWKDTFNQKEIELSVAHQNFQAKETENAELCKKIGALKEASNEVNMMKGNLEKNVFILSEDKNQQREVIGCLHKANGKLERAMTKLQKEIKEHKFQEEYLKSELQKEIVKADMWEMEAAELYENLQLSNVHSTIFAEKSYELIQEYKKEVVKLETIDKCFKNEIQKKMHEAEILEIESAADADSEELGTIAVLEGENGVTGDLTVLFLLILSLRDSLTSLEELGLSLGKIHEIGNQETQDSLSASHQHKMSIQAQNQAHSASEPFRILELQKLQSKVQAVEKAVQEAKRFLKQESSKVTAKLEVAVEEIKELNFESNVTNAEVRLSNDISVQPQGGSMSKNVPDKDEIEVSYEKMKDIHLVHVSDSSSYQNGLDSYVTGRGECVETNYHMLKVLKDTSDCSFGPNIRDRQELANDSDEDPMQYLQVDKLEVSEKVHKAPQEGDNKMVQRIASDIGRLMNIQARVQDLKNKIESLRKSNCLMVFEYDSLKGQLGEVEQTVSQLVEMDDKLRKNAKEVSLGPFKSFEGLRKNGNLRKRRVSEQARNWSEKIGRLELDVQRIQFTLLRLEDKFECKGRKHVERRSKVILRDYLFGKKKRPVCVCVSPAARED